MRGRRGRASDGCRAASAAGSAVRSRSIACAAVWPSMMMRSVGPRVSAACQECRGVALQRTSTVAGRAAVPWSQAWCRGHASGRAASRSVVPGGRVPAAGDLLPRCSRGGRALAGTRRPGRVGFLLFFMTLLPPIPVLPCLRTSWTAKPPLGSGYCGERAAGQQESAVCPSLDVEGMGPAEAGEARLFLLVVCVQSVAHTTLATRVALTRRPSAWRPTRCPDGDVRLGATRRQHRLAAPSWRLVHVLWGYPRGEDCSRERFASRIPHSDPVWGVRAAAVDC